MNSVSEKQELSIRQTQKLYSDNGSANYSSDLFSSSPRVDSDYSITEHMQSNGIDYHGEIFLDDKIHRFSCDRNKMKKDEWYVGTSWVYLEKVYRMVNYGSWSTGGKFTFKSWGKDSFLPDSKIKKVQTELQEQYEKEKKRNYEIAAQASKDIWESSKDLNGQIAYIEEKHIKPYGVRYGKYYDATHSMIIPIQNVDGEIRSLQYIFERNGKFEKRFHYQGEKKGCFHVVGSLDGAKQVFICEGYATACSIYEACQEPVIVAFDCGNLEPVVQRVQKKYPEIEIIIASDYDHQTENNPGITKAKKASQKYGCAYLFPSFKENEKMPDGSFPTDFNDLYIIKGVEEVKRQLNHSSPYESDPKVMKDFFLNESGLFYRSQPNAKEENSNPIRVSATLEILAITRDADNKNHGKLLRFRDYDHMEHLWSMPLEFLSGDGSDYRKVLLSMGLHIEGNKLSNILLKKYIQDICPSKRMRCVDKLGWFGDHYIFPESTIGEMPEEEIIFQSSKPTSNLHQTKGSLEEWKKHISQYCVDNSRLAFSVSVAFAAPVLHIMNEENGGFHLRGASSGGKTTALKVANSVFGGEEMLRSWKATSNGFESIATLHNDSLLCLDELGKLNPKIAGEVAYHLVNGEGKQRCDKSGYAKERQSWRLLFISSGEMGLPDLIREAGQKVRGGHEVRVIDIPAFTDKYGVFEHLHGYASGDIFSRMLCSNVKKSHGTAGKEFIDRLIKNLSENKKLLEQFIDQFKKDHVPSDADGQVLRVLNRFALVAAAGSLATVLGITGWPEEEASWAAKQCFDEWLQNRDSGTSNQEEEEILSQVRYFFEQHGSARFTEVGDEDLYKTNNRAGYKKDEYGRLIFFVLREVFKREICHGFDARLVAKILKNKGWLIPGTDGKITRSEKLPLSDKNTRCYKFDGRKIFSDEGLEKGEILT